jgi:hypothetical protein
VKALDWRRVLAEHSVPYVDRGANVKRGEINIRCPFCGTADPSHHMGLNLETGWWACWRNREHRGKSPLWLLTRLLNVSYWRARQIAGLDDNAPPDPDGFDAVAARIMGRDSRIERMEQVRREFLTLPTEFQPLRSYGAGFRFFDYLASTRGFGKQATEELSSFYKVRAALTGRWQSRIVLPYFMNGELVAWTGRAIARAEIRYLDLPLDECLVPIKETLYNHDAGIKGGSVLVVVEGPLDALKIDAFGFDLGVRAVALSTNSLSEQQGYLIEEMAGGFDRVVVMMDTASSTGLVDSMRMKQDLRTIPNLKIMPVPFGLKDAAEMTMLQVRTFTERIEQEIA